MPSSIGIYIGSENVDVVVLSGSFQRPRMAGFARAKLPSEESWRAQIRVEGPATGEAPAASTAQVEESISRLIRQIDDKLGLTRPRAYAGLSSESVVVRYFQMPTLPAHERKLAIAFEAKKYLPFKLEELVTDFRAVVKPRDPTLMRVMFFGVKSSTVDMYTSLFQAAELVPLCLEPASISLIRLARQTGQLPGGQVAALIAVEPDTASISIAREDLLYLSRNLTLLPGPPEPAPSAELLEALVNETRVSIDYYRRRFLGEPAVGKIILFNQSLDPARIQELSRVLNLPVELGEPFKKIAGAQSVPAGLSIAAGLALRGLERKTGEINLLPLERRKETLGLFKPLVAEAAAAVLVLGTWYGLSMSDLNRWQQKLASVRASQIQPVGVPSRAALTELRTLRGTGEREERTLKTLASTEARPSQILSEISRLMPEETWLRYLFLRETLRAEPGRGSPLPERRRVLRLIGGAYAADRDRELEKVHQFLATLRASEFFGSAFSEFSLDAVERGQFWEEEITDFRLTCATHPEELKLDLETPTPLRRRGGR